MNIDIAIKKNTICSAWNSKWQGKSKKMRNLNDMYAMCRPNFQIRKEFVDS